MRKLTTLLLLMFALLPLATAASVEVAQWYPQGASYVFVCNATAASSYDWQFGDGEQLLATANQDVYHYFAQDSQYNISCAAHTEAGVEDASTSVTVASNTLPADVNYTRTVNMSIHPWFPKGNDYVFSCDANYEATHYDWYFGDGTKLLYVQNQNVFHTFADNASHTVTCVARLYGLKQNASITIGSGTSDGGGNKPADIILFSETFPDSWPYGWTTLTNNQPGCCGSYSYATAAGAERLRFDNDPADANGTIGIGKAVDIPVTDATWLWYDVRLQAADMPTDCGVGCPWYPANVVLDLDTTHGPDQLRIAYATNERGNNSFVTRSNIPLAQWLRGEHYRIQDIVPDATRVTHITLNGTGWHVETLYDNVMIVDSFGSTGSDDADLAVTAVTVQDWLMEGTGAGQEENLAHINITFANVGVADAQSGWRLRYALSRDTQLSDDDVVLEETTRSTTMGAGSSETREFSVALPAGTPAGLYYLLAAADADDAVAESDEQNNVGVYGPVFVASETLDPEYHPAEEIAASVQLAVAQGFPFEHNYVFQCLPSNFMPTQYTFDYGEEGSDARAVPDDFHTFAGNGTYNVTCTATDGTNTATDTILVNVETPIAPADLHDTDGLHDGFGVSGGGIWGVMLNAKPTAGLSAELSCREVGFRSTMPIGWSIPEATLDGRADNDRLLNVTFAAPGTYTVRCGAGIQEAWQWTVYYMFQANIYHTNRSCCTGYGVDVNVTVPAMADPETLIAEPTASADVATDEQQKAEIAVPEQTAPVEG